MILIALAGVAAGAINTLVGSGTLVTFPTLVALGYPPVVSTMSNAIGLVARSLKHQVNQTIAREIARANERLVAVGTVAPVPA